MYAQVLALVFCLALSLRLEGQSTIDSLKKTINESLAANDNPSLASQYANVGYHYISRGQYDSSLLYYRKSLGVNNPNANLELRASSLNAVGSVYSYLGQADSSIIYYQQALTAYTALNDEVHAAMVETNLSILFKNVAVYDKSLEYAFKALRRQEKLGDQQSMSSSFNTVSLVYMKVKDYEKALQYGYKALEARKKISYEKGIAHSYNNIGEVFLSMHRYDSAVSNLEKSLRIKRRINERKSFSTTLSNLGTAYLHLGRLNEAQDLFSQSLSYRIEFGDRIGQAGCYNSLARVAMHFKEDKKVDDFLRKAENILKETPAPEVLKENLEIRIQYCQLSEKLPLAVEYMRRLIAVKDTILTSEKAQSMNALQVRYETEKKEQQIMLLQEQGLLKNIELKAKQSMIYALTGGVFLLVVIAGLAFNNFRVARKGKMMQELFNKELNHRVKNNLQLLSSLLSLQSQELTDEVAVTAVKRNESRVNAMALIHRKLYMGENNRTVNMHGYIRELLDFLLYSYSYGEDDLTVELHAEDVELDVDRAIPLGLILNEVISNSLKYAFHSVTNPEINVSLKVAKGKDLVLQVSDNGPGFDAPEAVAEGHSFGLKMIHLLTKEMRGTLHFQTDSGTTVEIKIPLK